MGASERSDSFWVDDVTRQGVKVRRRDGQVEVREGFSYVWTRNELGCLYLKSLGQIGYHLAPRYTIQEYAVAARKMAEAHAAGLSPEIKAAVGNEVMMAELMAPMNVAAPIDDGPASGPVFL